MCNGETQFLLKGLEGKVTIDVKPVTTHSSKWRRIYFR